MNTRDVFTGLWLLPDQLVAVFRSYLAYEYVLNRQSLERRLENKRRQGLDMSAEEMALAAWPKE